MAHKAAIIAAFDTIYLCRNVTIEELWIDAEDYAPIRHDQEEPRWFGAGSFPSNAVVLPVHPLLLDAVKLREGQ